MLNKGGEAQDLVWNLQNNDKITVMRLQIIPTAYLLLRILFAAVAMVFLTMMHYSSGSISMVVVALCVYVVTVKRFDYLDPFVVFLMPWLLILSFTLFPLSYFANIIHPVTYRLVFFAVFSAVIVAGGGTQHKSEQLGTKEQDKNLRFPAFTYLFLLDLLFLGLTALNVFLAGYIPLIQGLRTGDTGYTEFGIHGLYGFYLAFANALALFYFFLYLGTRKPAYLVRYFLILFVFILFVTRQNVLSVAIESVALFSLTRKRIQWKSIAVFVGVFGMFFSVLGSFRSGAIKEIAGIKDQYQWVPEPVIWLYAYSYFNIANVDKLITTSGAPFFDGTSVAYLIPSFLRPTSDTEQYLEVSNFNVSSYLSPIYQDVGTWGVLAFTSIVLWRCSRRFRRAQATKSFSNIASYSVLYFCAFFSFFVNFWFYLPVIFQLAFFPFFSRLAEAVMAKHLKTSTSKSISDVSAEDSSLSDDGSIELLGS